MTQRISTFILVGTISINIAESAWAQGVYNQSAIFIHGTDIHVAGEVSNEGTIENEGRIAFTGDWKSKGDYKGTGVLEANGWGSQDISHGTQPIHTLVINGGHSKRIRGTVEVSASLELRQGIVAVSSWDMLLLLAGSAATGGSEKSYVDGALTVQGSGPKFLPLGKNGRYAPIEFPETQADGAQYSWEVFDNTPAIIVGNTIAGKGWYWQRKDLTGALGSATVSIDYENNRIENPDQLVLLNGNSLDEPFIAVGDVVVSPETGRISTRTPLSGRIIMLGEVSHEWSTVDFYFPTALSPHALHAENKTAKIFGDRLSEVAFRFQVFDRWGNLVFECLSLEQMKEHGWDGRASTGKALSTGNYPYHLSARDKEGKRFERKGFITIVN